MLRRKPTRIELKLDDLEEWKLKKEKEQEKKQQQVEGAAVGDTPGLAEAMGLLTPSAPKKSRKEVVQERIGYDPRPVNLFTNN